jgi:hypothetical protein
MFELTAPIFTTGWDGNVRVTLFADGRIGVRAELVHRALSSRSQRRARPDRHVAGLKNTLCISMAHTHRERRRLVRVGEEHVD